MLVRRPERELALGVAARVSHRNGLLLLSSILFHELCLVLPHERLVCSSCNLLSFDLSEALLIPDLQPLLGTSETGLEHGLLQAHTQRLDGLWTQIIVLELPAALLVRVDWNLRIVLRLPVHDSLVLAHRPHLYGLYASKAWLLHAEPEF